MDNQQSQSVDTYIAVFPANVREILQKIRRVIREAAPEAQETISYGMPTFKFYGNLVHFAGWRTHIGFYPTPSGITAFQKELAPYGVTKGAIRFPLDQPIPYALIKKIVKLRVKENLSKRKAPKQRN